MDYKPEWVQCPLNGKLIEAIDCLENQDVVRGWLVETSMPSCFKEKDNWKEICRQCRWQE